MNLHSHLLSKLLVCLFIGITTSLFSNSSLHFQQIQSQCPIWKKHCYGRIEFSDKSVYRGAISYGRPSGKGEMTWPDGSRYQGYFDKGMREGFGEFENKEYRYEGEWKADKMHGEGAYIWATGEEYIGMFKDDNIAGEGTILLASGCVYSGSWEDGLAHGHGTFTREDQSTYIGWSEHGKRHGEGMIVFPSNDTLHGYWADGRLNGEADFIFSNGDRMVMEWHHGTLGSYASYETTDEDYFNISPLNFQEVYQDKLREQNPNFQLTCYAIGKEYKANSQFQEAKKYFQLAFDIGLEDSSLDAHIAFSLQQLEENNADSGWANLIGKE